MPAQYDSCQGCANRLNVPVALVRALARNGDVAVLRIPGARARVDVDEVRKALERHTRRPDSDAVAAGGLQLETKAS